MFDRFICRWSFDREVFEINQIFYDKKRILKTCSLPCLLQYIDIKQKSYIKREPRVLKIDFYAISFKISEKKYFLGKKIKHVSSEYSNRKNILCIDKHMFIFRNHLKSTKSLNIHTRCHKKSCEI